jgi:prepilin-type N-terminal cleavage/methylation domain-containing protein
MIPRITIKNGSYAPESGFTFLELMLSVAIFSSVVIIAGQIFLNTMRSQRQSIEYGLIEESARYALEVMSKELRGVATTTGEGPVDCTPGAVPEPCSPFSDAFNPDNDDSNFFSAVELSGSNLKIANIGHGDGDGSRLVFKNKSGGCVQYRSASDNRIWVDRVDESCTMTSMPLTPAGAKASKLYFLVREDGDLVDVQSSVTVSFVLESAANPDIKPVTFQTTITSRQYGDIP